MPVTLRRRCSLFSGGANSSSPCAGGEARLRERARGGEEAHARGAARAEATASCALGRSGARRGGAHHRGGDGHARQVDGYVVRRRRGGLCAKRRRCQFGAQGSLRVQPRRCAPLSHLPRADMPGRLCPHPISTGGAPRAAVGGRGRQKRARAKGSAPLCASGITTSAPPQPVRWRVTASVAEPVAAMEAAPPAEAGNAEFDIDVVLGVRLATPKQAAAWAALRLETEEHTLRRAWLTWRAAVAEDASSGSDAPSEQRAEQAQLPGSASGAHSAASSSGGEEAEAPGAADAARVAKLAAFATARRLRSLSRAWRALRGHAWLQREVWRRGHRALMARNGACAGGRF